MLHSYSRIISEIPTSGSPVRVSQNSEPEGDDCEAEISPSHSPPFSVMSLIFFSLFILRFNFLRSSLLDWLIYILLWIFNNIYLILYPMLSLHL